VGVIAAASLLAACGGGSSDGVRVEKPGGGSGSAVVRREASPTPAATPTLTPTPTPTPTPGPAAVTALRAWTSRYGDPPNTSWARLRIPVLGVDAPVGTRAVGRDGVMALPAGPSDVAWYDLAAWPGMGGTPGEGGNAVFSGHLDYDARVHYANAEYRGQAVFGSLRLLTPGDTIEVVRGGRTLRYTVKWVRQLSADPARTDWGEVWSSNVPVESLTLYTCGGDFDAVTQGYRERVVVRAERVG